MNTELARRGHVSLWQQVDCGGTTYILDGIPYGKRSEMARLGWKWCRGVGCRGCYITRDKLLADAWSERMVAA